MRFNLSNLLMKPCAFSGVSIDEPIGDGERQEDNGDVTPVFQTQISMDEVEMRQKLRNPQADTAKTKKGDTESQSKNKRRYFY